MVRGELKNLLESARPGRRSLAAFVALAAIGAASWHVQPFFSKQPRPVRSTEVASAKPDVKAALSSAAMAFEPNQGQTDPRVKYLSRGSGYTVFLTENEAVIRLKRAKAEKSAVVAMKFAGQTPKNVAAESRQEGHTNYLVGPESKWLTKIPNYSQVRYTEVFPGVDAKFYGDGTRLRYDLIVNKGADPSQIALAFSGGNKLSLDKKGNLLLSTDSGDVVYEKPYLYQEIAGTKKTVEGGYRILDNDKVGFEIGAYDANETLVIDPIVAFSTYLGGTLADQVNAVTHDVLRAYATGQTLSPDFPLAASGGSGTPVFPKDAITDVFVVAINNIGTTRVWTTYFGGTLTDIGNAIAIAPTAPDTSLIVAGNTTSKDMAGTAANPNTGPVGQDQDAFIASFNSLTGVRNWSQYIGGNSNDFGNAVVISGTQAVVVGTTSSANFTQTAGGADATVGGTQDAFAIRVDWATGALGQATYLGGDGVESGNAVTVGPAGTLIVVGDSTSTNTTGFASLPTGTNNLQANNNGAGDGFLAVMADTLTVAPTQISYVGGAGTDTLTAVTWNPTNSRAVIAGNTTSTNLGVTTGAAQGTNQGGQDGFVGQFPLAPTPLRYTYLTYLGGSGTDSITGIARDITEQVYVVGGTSSSNFPAVRAVQSTLGGAMDGYVSRLAADGRSINNSTFFGGSGNDMIRGLSLDPLQKALYFGGWTDGGGIPTSFAAYRPTPVGDRDGFLTNWVFNDLTVTPNNPTFTMPFGDPSQNQILSLNWTNQINTYSFSAVTYGGPAAPGTACQGWLTVSQQGASAIQVTVNPTSAGCSGPGTAFTGTFTVDGGGDNGPQTVVVTLNLTSTTTPPGAVTRWFEKGTNFVTTNGPNPAMPTNVANNMESFLIQSAPNALPYTATVAFTGTSAPCAGAITVQASGTTAASGTNFTVTYVKSVLDNVNLATLPLIGTNPSCVGTVTYVVPGTTPNTTTPITIVFTSRLQVVSASGLTETFNFVDMNSPAATRTSQVRGDDLDVLFNAAVTGQLTATTGVGTCPAGALTVVAGPFTATNDQGFLNPADVNITVNPLGCTNMTQYRGEVTLTPVDPLLGDPVKITVNANVGNALVVNVPLPAGLAMGASTPNALGTSISTDTLPSALYTRTVNVTTGGPNPPFGSVTFNVTINTAAQAPYAGTPTQAAGSATGWLRATPASGTATNTTPAVLTVTVDPTVWAGLAGSAAGIPYTGNIILTDTATTGAVPTVTIPVTFVKYTQPLVVAPTALNFAGQVGAGIIAPQTVNVQLTTGWPSIPPDFTVDAMTMPGPGNYPGYGFPADLTGGIFPGGQNAASWLSVSPLAGATTVGAPGANVQVQANVTNLTVGTYTGVIRFRHAGSTATSFSGANPRTVTVTLVVTSAIPPPPTGGLQFVAINPCRIMDSRGNGFTGSFGPPSLVAGGIRTVPVPSSTCAIPVTARAYSVNITAIPKTGSLGFLTVWPTGQVQPGVSTLNSPDGQIVANGAIIPAGVGGAVDTYVTNDADLVIDINGYFVPPGTATLQFYPVSPCRSADTRLAGQTPALAGGSSRNFTIAGSCGVPASAVAVSVNLTVVPTGPLGYITMWPAGATQPFVSTTNSLDGTIRSNNAIVPTGTGGAVSVFATNTTEVVIDVNGYYAPPATGGLNFFSVAPCRVVDTRDPAGPFGGPIMAAGTSRTFAVSTSGCGLPGTSKAYVTNLTVVPTGALGYLTAYPTGIAAPFVSNLNSPKGIVVANGAVVPSGTAGAIDIFVLNQTHVIIDANGYFQ